MSEQFTTQSIINHYFHGFYNLSIPRDNTSYWITNRKSPPKDTQKSIIMKTLNVLMFTSVFLHSKLNTLTNQTELWGTDAEIFRILKTRFTINFTFHEQMELTAETIGVNSFDMAAVGCFIRHYELYNGLIRFSTAIGTDRLCCVVPKADRYPNTLLPLLVFSPIVWTCLFCSFLLLGTSWMLIHRVLNRPRFLQGLLKYILLALQTIFGEPSLKAISNAERILLLTMYLSSTVLVTEFVTFLTIICLSPMYYNKISSVAELLDSGLPIWIQTEFYKNDIFNAELKNRIEYINTTEWIPRSIGEGTRRLATIERENSFHLDLQPWAMSKKLQFVQECLRTYFVAFVFSRRCKACKDVNHLLGQLLNGGFIDKWTKDMQFNKSMEDWPIYLEIQQEQVGNYYFRLHDMLFAFILLVLGHAIAFAVLVVEIWSKQKRAVESNAQHKQQAKIAVNKVYPFVH